MTELELEEQKRLKEEMSNDWKEFPQNEGITVTPMIRAVHREHFGTDGAYDTDEQVYNWYWNRDEKVKECIEIQKLVEELAGASNAISGNEAIGFVTEKLPSKYHRICNKNVIDIYDVMDMYDVASQPVGHAIKKLLMSGQRGYKDKVQDLEEALQAIQRAIELEM